MERAPIHRAIVAPTAVVGSLLSFVTAVLLSAGNQRGSTSFFHLSYPGAARHFMAIWFVVLGATLMANVFLHFAEGAARRQRFYDTGTAPGTSLGDARAGGRCGSHGALLAERRDDGGTSHFNHNLDHLLRPGPSLHGDLRAQLLCGFSAGPFCSPVACRSSLSTPFSMPIRLAVPPRRWVSHLAFIIWFTASRLGLAKPRPDERCWTSTSSTEPSHEALLLGVRNSWWPTEGRRFGLWTE